MQEKIVMATKEVLKPYNAYVVSSNVLKENNLTTLEIAIGSNKLLDLNTITEISNLINPIIDELDLISESYVLDIYSKGVDDNER